MMKTVWQVRCAIGVPHELGEYRTAHEARAAVARWRANRADQPNLELVQKCVWSF